MKAIPRVRVFVGSTFEDLRDHRRRLIETLQELDVRVEAMEFWSAAPGDPLEECLSRVSESDIYLCVVGFRYGCTTAEGLSYTETEYKLARELGKDCLAFLMDDTATVQARNVDSGGPAEKVSAFRECLAQELLCTRFRSPEDLALRAVMSLLRLLGQSGTAGAAGLDLDDFWKEMHRRWTAAAPEDVRMPFRVTDDEIALVEQGLTEVRGLVEFHEHIRLSYAQLRSDLEALLLELGLDPSTLEGSGSVRERFEFRDWEMVTFFPNRTNHLRILLSQLRVKLLERPPRGGPANADHVERLMNARSGLQEAIEEGGVYID